MPATPYASCRVGQWQGNDCFHDHFFPGDEPTYFSSRAPGSPGHRDRHLRQAGERQRPRRPLHRPARLVPRRARREPGPADHRVRPPSPHRRELAVPHLAEQHARRRTGRRPSWRTTRALPDCSCTTPGHTHRNKRTISPVAPGVTLQEIAAGKEYPGGFSLLRLHTGGFALNFYKTRSDLARAVERTKPTGDPRRLAAVRARQQRLRPQHRRRTRPLGPATSAPRARGAARAPTTGVVTAVGASRRNGVRWRCVVRPRRAGRRCSRRARPRSSSVSVMLRR